MDRAKQLAEWMAALEARHLADLTFSEVARALRALSATYVEKRTRIGTGAALSGAGKRAAFALFYAPLHFLLIREIAASLPVRVGAKGRGHRQDNLLVDLGCGTGAAGAAWAVACEDPPKVVGIDLHPWALKEAAATYRAFGLTARTVRGDVSSVDVGRSRSTLLAAFVVNELPEAARQGALDTLLARANAGHAVLIVEPLAGFVAPWWSHWRSRVEDAGGRSDEWRVRVELPEIVQKLDRAAGMNHRELTGRSLWIPGVRRDH